MPRDPRSLPRPRRLHHLLGLGLSGAALAAMVYVETVSAHEELDDEVAALLEDDAFDDEALAEPSIAPATVSIPFAAPAPAPPPLLAAAEQTEASEAELEATDAPVPAMVVMPDISGLRLRAARRELKALGLKLSVRDEWGEKIPREWWSDYKVGKQTVEAGTEVEPGSWVRVKAKFRYSGKLAKGY